MSVFYIKPSGEFIIQNIKSLEFIRSDDNNCTIFNSPQDAMYFLETFGYNIDEFKIHPIFNTLFPRNN